MGGSWLRHGCELRFAHRCGLLPPPRLHGAPDKYHETITRSWFHFIAVHIQRQGAESFGEFIERNPDLLDRKLIEHFYSRELILSESARAAWVGPDLRALPALA